MSESDRPLRILHLTSGSDAGGISRYLYEMCTALHERGHSVSVAGARGAWHSVFTGAPWPWLELPLNGGPLELFQASRSLLRVLEREPVDVIHAHYRKATLVARRLANALHVPVLFTLHLTGIPLGFPWGFLTDWGDLVHTPSEHGRRWLLSHAHVRSERIRILPHGIDARKFPVSDAADREQARRELGLPVSGRLAAFVGRFDTPKNEDWMLDLAARSRSTLPDLHVVMVGGGPHEAQLRQRVRDDQLESRVTILPYRDPLPIYRAADAVLLPSAHEGFSFVNTEAMSVGRPVLRTRTAGAQEQIVESVTGVSTPIDHEAFLQGAAAMLSDRQAMQRMGEAAAKFVRERLTLDRAATATIDLYRQLVNRG